MQRADTPTGRSTPADQIRGAHQFAALPRRAAHNAAARARVSPTRPLIRAPILARVFCRAAPGAHLSALAARAAHARRLVASVRASRPLWPISALDSGPLGSRRHRAARLPWPPALSGARSMCRLPRRPTAVSSRPCVRSRARGVAARGGPDRGGGGERFFSPGCRYTRARAPVAD